MTSALMVCVSICSRRRVNVWYLCEVGVLGPGQDASEEGRTVETHH